MMTLVASVLAGGDCIDDTDALRAGGTARLGLGEQVVTTNTLRRRFFALAGRLTRSRAASLCIFPGAGLGKPSSAAPWPGCEPFHSQPDGTVGD